jgi:hypothetical protein
VSLFVVCMYHYSMLDFGFGMHLLDVCICAAVATGRNAPRAKRIRKVFFHLVCSLWTVTTVPPPGLDLCAAGCAPRWCRSWWNLPHSRDSLPGHLGTLGTEESPPIGVLTPAEEIQQHTHTHTHTCTDFTCNSRAVVDHGPEMEILSVTLHTGPATRE